MIYYGADNLVGGDARYGYVAGILSLSSCAPRLPGDPVHAQTFDFPVCHAVVEGVTIRDLIALDSRNIQKIIGVAKTLERRGVRFIATSCGLFAPFQNEIADQLNVPFLSSALQMVSFLRGFLARGKVTCVFTAHSGLLTQAHLRSSGFGLQDVVVKGLENYPEFARIVIDGERNIDPERFRQDIVRAAEDVKKDGRRIDLVVLECPNLVTFRAEIQRSLAAPVFDMVNLIDFFAAACRLRAFPSAFF